MVLQTIDESSILSLATNIMPKRHTGAVLRNGRAFIECKRCHKGRYGGEIDTFRNRIKSPADQVEWFDDKWICEYCSFYQKWRGAIKRR